MNPLLTSGGGGGASMVLSDPSALNKADLLESLAETAAQLERAEALQALPLPVEMGLSSLVAGGVSYADAARGGSAEITAGVAAATTVAAIAVGPGGPGGSVLRAAAIGATNALAANFGRDQGVKAKLEAERRRAEEQAKAPAQSATA